MRPTPAPDGFADHSAESGRMPRRLFAVPLAVGVVLVALNFQWLRLYQLRRAPTADALVYLTEAYRDFWLLRDAGPAAVFAKYVSGVQQTGPTLWWSAGAMFLLFGTDPANAHLVLALAYLLWIAGGMALAWRLRPGDRSLAVASGLGAALLPSTTMYGLRVFMLDLVAAAAFVSATVLLLDSDGLRRRRVAIAYGALCGLNLLIRTTIVPFLLAHAAMLFVLSIRRRRPPSYLNAGLAVLAGLLVAGWFLLPNLPRILSYYGYWASVGPGDTGAERSWFSGVRFYGGLIHGFHFSPGIFRIYVPLLLVGLALAVWRISVRRNHATRRDAEALVLLGVFVSVPVMVLSLYPSRAPWVDYPLVIGYVLLPIVAWRIAVPAARWFWLPVLVLLIPMGARQMATVIRAPQSTVSADWREREALARIFDDAARRGLARVRLGSTAIHQHNALGYEYWVLADAFPAWRGRVDVAVAGRRTESPEDLAAMNSGADYIVTLENYDGGWHPNNRAAPEANRLLQRRGFRPLGPALALPDGARLILLAKSTSVSLPPPQADGWHPDGVAIRIANADRTALRLRLRATLLAGSGRHAEITLSRKPDGTNSGPAGEIWTSNVTSGPELDAVFEVPAAVFGPTGDATFSLRSSWAHDPDAHPINPERRRLAFRALRASVQTIP